MPGESLKIPWKSLLFAVGVGAICTLVALQVHTGTQTASAPTPTTPETVTVSVPPNSLAPAGTVTVAIPSRIVDKLGPSHDSGLAGIWPAATALLGTLAGALLTFATTSQKNKQDRTTAEQSLKQAVADRVETRQHEIKDLSLQACLALLTAGRLLAMGIRTLWVDCANEVPRDKVEGSFSRLEPVIRDWYVAYEVLLLRLPPGANAPLVAYRKALNRYLLNATRWRDDYLASIPSAAPPGSPPVTPVAFPPGRHTAIKSKRRENDVFAKREDFVDIVNTYFHEAALSTT